MGVSGLWQILNKAGESRALVNLAVVQGFDKNEHGTRTFRLGVDCGIWLRHAIHSGSSCGHASAGISTLFYRLCRLSQVPFTVLFVFDGRDRPKDKRGSKIGKSGSHYLAPQFKKLIRIFGMDWREAKGEAEAELARLNQLGYIDAVLSDDVDTLLFGARMLIKNVSLTLAGNKAYPARDVDGKPSNSHAMIYTADAIKDHPDIGLTRGGMILIGLLSGGDYDSGVKGVGIALAHGLARLGFGDRLLLAYRTSSPGEFSTWLHQWRNEMTLEIQTNASGLLSSRHPSVTIPTTFPDIDVLASYVWPALSEHRDSDIVERRAVDLPALASFCEQHFVTWGTRSAVFQRFSTLVYQSVVVTALTKSAVIADRREMDRLVASGMLPDEAKARVKDLWHPTPEQALGTPTALVRLSATVPKTQKSTQEAQTSSVAPALINHGRSTPRSTEQLDIDEDLLRHGVESGHEDYPLVVTIHGMREHVSTDKLLEYRVEIRVRQLVRFVERGLKSNRPKPAPLHGSVGTRRGTEKARSVSGRLDNRSKIREGFVTEEEVELDWSSAVIQGTEDSDDGNEQETAGKRIRDPNANIRMWIPASMLRHAHPALVESYEEKLAMKKTKKRKVAMAAPPRTAHSFEFAESSSSPQPAQEFRHGKDVGPAYDTAIGALPSSPCCMGLAASSPAPGVLMGQSSLPLRSCGFMFTWPDPDDPDMLVVDTDDRDDLSTRVNYAAVEHATNTDASRSPAQVQNAPTGSSGPNRITPAPSAVVVPEMFMTRDRPTDMVPSTTRVNFGDGNAIEECASANIRARRGQQRDIPRPQGPPQPISAVIPGSLFSDYLAVERGRGTKRKLGMSASAAAHPNLSSSARTLALDDDMYTMRDSSEEPELPWISPGALVPDSPSAFRAQSHATLSHSISSSRALLVRRPQTRVLQQEVIDISSDSDDEAVGDGRDDDLSAKEWWNLPPFNHQPSLYSQRKSAAAGSTVSGASVVDSTVVSSSSSATR